MTFKVKLFTSGGGRREVELPATSVQDAIDQTMRTYINCKIESVDLIPQKQDSIRIFAGYGEQYEIGRSLIYDPFSEDV